MGASYNLLPFANCSISIIHNRVQRGGREVVGTGI